jgi:hypothetical protein
MLFNKTFYKIHIRIAFLNVNTRHVGLMIVREVSGRGWQANIETRTRVAVIYSSVLRQFCSRSFCVQSSAVESNSVSGRQMLQRYLKVSD